jgi:hypothetical protein
MKCMMEEYEVLSLHIHGHLPDQCTCVLFHAHLLNYWNLKLGKDNWDE